MKKRNPIGLFDSGIGGVTIWKEIIALLPHENTLFLADNKNAPYGAKSKEEIIALCDANTQFLLQKKVKIIVVACNTGTTNAIAYLRNKYKEISFIGVEPAIKPAALKSMTKKVGVLATKGTLSSELFLKTSHQSAHKRGVKVVERVGEGLVSLIEQGQINSPEMSLLLQKYITPMVNEGIDYLVLGCTHYPFLRPLIEQYIPKNIQVIDSGYAVAKQTKNVLLQNDLLNDLRDTPRHIWLANGEISVLQQFAPDMQNLTIESINM